MEKPALPEASGSPVFVPYASRDDLVDLVLLLGNVITKDINTGQSIYHMILTTDSGHQKKMI